MGAAGMKRSTKRKFAITAAAAAAVALAGTGAVSAMAAAGGGDGRDPGRSVSADDGQHRGHDGQFATGEDGDRDHGAPDNEDAREARAAKVTAPQAAAAALRARPGTVTSLDLDQDRPGLVWDVDVVHGRAAYELVLDARTGKVLSDRRDRDDDDDGPVPHHAKVSAADAARIGARHATVTSVDLDRDDDHPKRKPVWEVEATDGQGREHQSAVDPWSGKTVQRAVGEDDD